MCESTPTLRRSWRPRFGLRTLFVLMTVICVWLGYQLNRIRQRHAVLVGNGAPLEGAFALPSDPPLRAPGGLWLLGEEGIARIYASTNDPDEMGRIQRLFPEAEIIPPSLKWQNVSQTDGLNPDQRLIVACHRVDVDGVIETLRQGADVNARFGKGDTMVFQDPWFLGWPVAANRWTPLIALASASHYPNPSRKIENSLADLNWAREQQSKIAFDRVEQRAQDALTITLILLSRKADIDADDGHGATALYKAIYNKKLKLTKLLLSFNAQVNTKTGVYIDGAGDVTPLHRAYWSPELTRLLLEKGADPKAKDSTGCTPPEWSRDPAVKGLYSLP